MRIAVIGAGAAGMMAAIAAAEEGASVTVFERNPRPGMKINITGKGRCNLTNACSVQDLIRNTPGNGRFLYSSFQEFDSEAVMAWFEAAGMPVKVERGNRVYPVSERAMDVTDTLRRRMNELGVRLVQSRISSIVTENGAVAGVKSEKGITPCDAVILCTGGKSYPRTGSTGDGYRMAQELGHMVTELRPSLLSLVAEEDIPARLEGLSLRNIAVTIRYNNKQVYDDFGEMVFTRRGVSGPVILSASAHVARDKLFPCRLSIDLKPALDAETLDKRILRDFEQNRNKDYINALSGLLPAKLIPVIAELSGIDPREKVNSITKPQRKKLLELLKDFSLTITGPGPFDEAVVTAGGISVKEVDPKTMESKLVSGLYFAGEILDVDGYTGGFNLQIAWSTGMKAGRSAARRE